ncbi:phosphodiester glycosidase family protein [Paenibacillus glycanilyticus]|uniref:Exopolysaccharide biosynthesis protein n=1 Tax=Paenibacillus glycanilyticus TaxID=126569 RepID=A0ABQ6GKF6_9BACL|nr:phosphodiester glycosidase family protein [Paenibacillus glycanilyticus]GLX70540.1 exopolysaccharide biosynthesis protein [Paenibacillus glycanilyticus]
MKKFLKITSIFIIVWAVISGIFMFFTDSGYQLRAMAAESILSSQHRQWAKYTFIPQSELDAMLKNINDPNYVNSATGKDDLDDLVNVKSDKDLYVSVESIEGYTNPTHYYKGKIITISNPKRVKLVSSQLADHGEQIFVIAKRAKALAAVNASGFVDLNGHGNGGASTGVVIENGVIKSQNKNTKQFVAGITKDGVMITGKYSANELINLGVQYAAGFKPQLIVNGQKMVQGDGGWGWGPRTAIGQKADGSIMLVVIDGRQARSVGASIKEVQDLLYDRGAINAMCMDGGSSSSMYFNGDNITIPSSRNNIPRYLPNVWALIPEAGDVMHVDVDGEQVSSFEGLAQ